MGQLTQARTSTVTKQGPDGQFVTQATQGAAPSAGVLGTIHQSFSRLLGYDVNLGYTRFSEDYSRGNAYVPLPTSPYAPYAGFTRGSIGTNMYELTIAEIFDGPRTKRFTTFGEFGGGGLFFLPIRPPSPIGMQIRPAMMYGVGMNYTLSPRWELRAEYRGLFYKSPDFNAPNSSIPITRLFTVTSEPTISLAYSFGKRRARHPRFY